MTPAATSRPASVISREDLDLGHLAVGELEDELVDAEAEHRGQDRPVGARRQRPAEEVAEAEMGAEPDPADDGLDRGVEQGREIRPARRDGSPATARRPG